VITMWVRAGMIRVESSAIGDTPPSTMISRNDRGITWVLDDSEKTFTEVPREGGDLRGAGTPGKAEKLKVTRTGQKKTLLGYRCERILFRKEGEETEIWGTASLRDLDTTITGVLGAGEEEFGGWTNELSAMGIFPMSAKTKVEGRVVESQEVTRVERKKLADALFEVPPGYRKELPSDMVPK